MAKSVKKPKFFYCELYMVNIYLYDKHDAKSASLSMKKHLGFEYDIDELEFGSKAFANNQGKFIIYVNLKEKEKIKTLAHECLHIANMILTRAGVEVNLQNDEAQAYLLGWLVKRCLVG